MANTTSPHSYLAITDDLFHHFAMYNTPTFKAKALCLVSNKGWVKRLLLLLVIKDG